jgi:O-antigen/teichoic acid export membrane protein
MNEWESNSRTPLIVFVEARYTSWRARPGALRSPSPLLLSWRACWCLPTMRTMSPRWQLWKLALPLLRSASIGLRCATSRSTGCAPRSVNLVFGITMALGSGKISAVLGIPAAGMVLQLYAFYLFVEGCSRMLRDLMLSHLLLQGRAQAGLVLRNLAWVGGLLWISHRGVTAVTAVALVELMAATVGLLAALAGLVYALRPLGSDAATVDPKWIPPSRKDLWALARSNYLSYLLTLTYGPQVITFMLSRFAGVEATAAFGFARNLADQVRRYLPTELLYGLVRPALVARYAASRDVAAFNRNNVLLFQVSLMFLAPLLVIGIAYGDLLVRVLGHGKFPDSAPLLVLLLLVLVPYSHRRIVELFANTVSQPSICARANAYLTACGPLLVLILWMRQPTWAAVVISLLAETAFSVLVVRQLQRTGVSYHLPWPALLRIAFSVVLSIGSLALGRLNGAGPNNLLFGCALAVLATGGFLWLCRPLDRDAQDTLKRLVV